MASRAALSLMQSSARSLADAADPLTRLAQLATEADESEIAADAVALATRLAEGRFYVACVGQFKRGKSTLLNALAGVPVLPTGVVPVTAVVTVLRHGEQLAAHIQFASGKWEEIDVADVAAYVTEERNPENIKGVAAVEVFVPSALLASGMCLVDTPGIGSVFAGNTAATRAFVPHIDAALVLVGTDPPLSADELALIQDLSAHLDSLLFVLGKADRFTAAERQEAAAFIARILGQRLGRAPEHVYHVSALQQLTDGSAGWDWDQLVAALRTLSQHAGSDLVRQAQERGGRRLTTRLMHALSEQRAALTRPLEETERKLSALRAGVREAERSLQDLGYLFGSEQDRFSAWFAQEREAFLERALTPATEELGEAVEALPVQRGPAIRREALTLAKTIAQRTLETWLATMQPRAEAGYRQIAARFIDLANAFLARLAGAGTAALTDLAQEIGAEVGFRTPRRFYCHLDESVVAMDLGSLRERCADVVRPRSRTVRRARQLAADLLADLLRRNSVLIHNDFDERVAESRRRLEAEIRERLQGLVASGTRALERARVQQTAGVTAVGAVLARLDRLAGECRIFTTSRTS